MRKGKLCFIVLFLVLFYWPNPALSHTYLYPTYKIDSITINLAPRENETEGDEADVYFPNPNVPPAEDAFPIVAVLQGAGVDKGFYSGFGTQLARFGFVVVIPNHFQSVPPIPVPVIFPDQEVILDVLTQMAKEDDDRSSPLFGIVDTDRMGLTGHSAGGAASLFAIDGSCQFPFCSGPSFFPLPEAVKAGAFYGTNTCGVGGDEMDFACIDGDASPPNLGGQIFSINNINIPVALVQGKRDGISTPAEATATINVIEGPSKLIRIPWANHFGIIDVKNDAKEQNITGAQVDPNPQFIPQRWSFRLIAWASGKFLLEALDDDDDYDNLEALDDDDDDDDDDGGGDDDDDDDDD